MSELHNCENIEKKFKPSILNRSRKITFPPLCVLRMDRQTYFCIYIVAWLLIMKWMKIYENQNIFFLDKPIYFFSWNWLQIETLPFCSWQSEPANVSSEAILWLGEDCLFIRPTKKINSCIWLAFLIVRLLYKYIGRIVRILTTLPFIPLVL